MSYVRHYCTRHAIYRAQQRLGLTLTNDDFKVIAGLILMGKTEFVNPQRHLEAHRLWYARTRMVVIFDRANAIVVTVLRKGAAEDGYVWVPQDEYEQQRRMSCVA